VFFMERHHHTCSYFPVAFQYFEHTVAAYTRIITQRWRSHFGRDLLASLDSKTLLFGAATASWSRPSRSVQRPLAFFDFQLVLIVSDELFDFAGHR
jgi:hypothetical protein